MLRRSTTIRCSWVWGTTRSRSQKQCRAAGLPAILSDMTSDEAGRVVDAVRSVWPRGGSPAG